MKKLIFLFVIILGCTTKMVVDERIPLNVIKPNPLILQEVKFSVLVDEESVLYCLDANGYKALSENVLQIHNYLKLQKQIIQNYEEYYGVTQLTE